MKTKKKNRFLTFCFSLLPGAGEMYMGFMRTGLSLMVLFFLAIFIPTCLRLDGLVVIAAIVWFYGFFHANHLVSLSDEEFEQVQDRYLFHEDNVVSGKDFVARYQKWVAIVLIAAGVILLWNTATDIVRRFLPDFIYNSMRIAGIYIPRILVALVIIFIGVKMIEGRKKQLANLDCIAGSRTEFEKEEETGKETGKDCEKAGDEEHMKGREV